MSIRASSIQLAVRDAVYTEIQTRKSNNEYVINTFDLVRTYLHPANLEAVETPIVQLTIQGFQEARVTRCPGTISNELSLMVSVVRRIEQSVDAGDEAVLLFEQMMDTVREVDASPASWNANNIVRDSSGASYDFNRLLEQNVLELIFYGVFTRTDGP